MATSRTGTSQWINVSRKVLRDAQDQGVTQCPYCRTTLDYKQRRAPNGAQVDHIIPHSRGGTDTPQNLTICCRTCNISKGNRPAPKTQTILKTKPLWTSRRW